MRKTNKDLVNQLVELFKMDSKKYEQFNKMMERTEMLTSDYGFDIEKTKWNKVNEYGMTERMYNIYELKGTRSSMRIVVDLGVGDEEPTIVRKPRGLVKNEYWTHDYHANGCQVWEMM